MHSRHQSTLRSNQSIHWIHHIAVKDRIPIYHLANDKPLRNILDYDLNLSLPGESQQMQMRREYIALTSWIPTSYLSLFKPFSNVVLRHIPHQYSEEMAQRSTDVRTYDNILLTPVPTNVSVVKWIVTFFHLQYPLGLLFKDENKSADLAEVLQYFQDT